MAIATSFREIREEISAELERRNVSDGRPEIFKQSLDRRRLVRDALAFVEGRDGLENLLDLLIGEVHRGRFVINHGA